MSGSGSRPIMRKIKLMRSSERMMARVLAALFLPLGAAWSQSPDYSDSHNWIMPATSNKPVDVFYVYPTVSADPSGYMDVNNEEDRGLAQSIYQAQASIFFDEANVYAPYYRQFSTGGETATPDYTRGQEDVKDAFQYYITNINPGLERSFILAGHSQGSRALKVLISDVFPGNALLAERLIAAYLIGETITDADLADTGVTGAQGAADTGVVISFNTQAFGCEPGPMVSSSNALCINPLSWTTNGAYASSNLHRGAVIYNHETGRIISGPTPLLLFCDAQIDTEKRGLMANIPDEWKILDFGAFGGGVYHRYDYDFWHENLKDNVSMRIAAYHYPDTNSVVVTATAGPHGSVEPSGSFVTNRGANITFLFFAETYWEVDSILTNGRECAAATPSFTWENLQSDSELQVTFSASSTSQGIPIWWLALYGWTNDLEAAAASDPDNDGLTTAQEYPLGSCPTNANTDADQYDDGIEALSGADPSRDDRQTYGAILDYPDLFGLYTTSNIGNLAFGCAMVAVTSNQTIHLTLQPRTCPDLTSTNWNDVGSPLIWSMPAEDGKAFYRMEGFSGE
ncbi:MAG: DUF3089 domain-containing protein [Spartobacteria bacterium]|nr:DUF3089 domain-containing protein [Spartobacteria bacterium]